MIQSLHPQGSPDWHAARAGVITASMFSSARYKTKKGEWSKEAQTYAFQLAIERLGGQPLDDGMETWAMKRGKELEPAARERHGKAIGKAIEPCGFFTTDDGRFGSSPDGLIGTDGVCEYKCLVSADRILRVVSTGDLSDFTDQIQGHMWITNRDFCDFVVYLPQLAQVHRDLYHRRIVRDDGYIAAMHKDLVDFDALVCETLDGLKHNLPVVTEQKAGW